MNPHLLPPVVLLPAKLLEELARRVRLPARGTILAPISRLCRHTRYGYITMLRRS